MNWTSSAMVSLCIFCTFDSTLPTTCTGQRLTPAFFNYFLKIFSRPENPSIISNTTLPLSWPFFFNFLNNLRQLEADWLSPAYNQSTVRRPVSVTPMAISTGNKYYTIMRKVTAYTVYLQCLTVAVLVHNQQQGQMNQYMHRSYKSAAYLAGEPVLELIKPRKEI